MSVDAPDRLKVDGVRSKIFLRHWAERLVPKDHLYQRKRGFHVPVNEWMSGRFLDQLEGKLLGNRAVATWFRRERLPDSSGARTGPSNPPPTSYCIIACDLRRLGAKGKGAPCLYGASGDNVLKGATKMRRAREPGMQQLGGVDASFLYFETPETPMHVAGLTTYQPPAGLSESFHAHFKRFFAQHTSSEHARGRMSERDSLKRGVRNRPPNP